MPAATSHSRVLAAAAFWMAVHHGWTLHSRHGADAAPPSPPGPGAGADGHGTLSSAGRKLAVVARDGLSCFTRATVVAERTRRRVLQVGGWVGVGGREDGAAGGGVGMVVVVVVVVGQHDRERGSVQVAGVG